jgi:ligand-binding sensor domain-containing protein/serine phosphatase RsbU (regulator of sigma subunit)
MLRLFSFVSILLSFSCYSQEILSAGKKFNFYTYNTEEGISSGVILKICQDSRGNIVACTRGGLSIYDGVSFKNYNRKEKLKFSPFGVTEDKSGNLWISGSGLALFRDNKFSYYDTSSGLPKTGYYYLYTDLDGSIWASGENYIVHLDPQKLDRPVMKIYSVKARIRFIKRKKNGTLMAGGEGEYFEMEKDSFHLRHSGPAVYDLVEFEDGREWCSGWGSGISEYKNGQLLRTYDFGTGILDMIRDKKGNVWLASWDKGIYKYDGKHFINYSTREGLPSNTYWSVFEDREGNIWFGAFGDGLVKYSGDKFSFLDKDYGLISDDMEGVGIDKKKRLWFGSSSGVSSYDPATGTIKNFETCNGKKFLKVMNSCIDSSGNVWLSGYANYEYKISGDKVEQLNLQGGFVVFSDSKGNIWMGSDNNGLFRYSKGEKKNFVTENLPGINRIFGIMEDKKGLIWCLHEGRGINVCDGDTMINISSKNGFVDNRATGVNEDNEGYLWFAVDGRGLFKCEFTLGRIKMLDSITYSSGLPAGPVSAPLFHKGKMYIGSQRGLCVINEADLKSHHIKIKRYGKSEGFVNSACGPAFFENDNLWLSTSKGTFCFNTTIEEKNSLEPVTHINDIKLFFETADWSPYSSGTDKEDLPVSLKLPYNQNHLTFSFTGISFTAPEKVLYQYMLQGLDEKWSPESNQREVIYPNIPPGTYTFMVKSCNSDSVWNSEPTTFVFTISPPFWKTTWFYILCTVLLICMFYIFIRWREKRLKKENLVLEDRVNQRTLQLKTALQQIEEKNKEITDSISYASKIQSVLLPSEKEIARSFDDVFIFFSPKDIVSGDFFWTMEKENMVYLAVCDSTGHGVPGAFMSLLNINYLNEAIAEKNLEKPGEVFDYVRKQLISSISKEGQKDGFDGILVCFDKRKNRFTYAAANNVPVLIRNGRMVEMSHDKMPVGKGEKNTPFTLFDQSFEKDDMLYLYTDGYADQFGGEKGKKFKYRQLDELLLEIYRLPASEQLAAISKKFNDWKGSLEQVDDVCIIGVRL